MTITRRLLAGLVGSALVCGPLAMLSPAHADPAVTHGGVAAWGSSGNSQTSVPVSLAGKKVTAIDAGGGHSLALTDDGAVTDWGYNDFSQSAVPASLEGKKVTAIDAGGFHSLALTDDGALTAWGFNEFGQTDVPTSLKGKKVTAISAGRMHSLALTEAGTVTAWGYKDYGQTSVPASLEGKKVTAIAAGDYFSLALTDDGVITGWGDNYYGRGSIPASLEGKKVTAISAGGYHSLALTDDGVVTGWGDNGNGQAGVPVSLDGEKVTAISAGGYHSLALTDDGVVTGWGYNYDGQASVPGSLDGKQVTAISAGNVHSVALYAVPGVLTGWADDAATVVAGSAATFTPTVSNAVAEASSSWTAATTGANKDNATATIDADGQVSVTSDTAGTYTVDVTIPTDVGDISTTVTVVVTPAAVASLALAGPDVALFEGEVTFTATGADRFGNPVGDETERIALSSSNTDDTISGGKVTVGSLGQRVITATHTVTAATTTHTLTVSALSFDRGPVATISGTAGVGQELTAEAGTVSPAPTSVVWQWFADEVAITGATDKTFTPAGAQHGAKLSVSVTVDRTGYVTATDTSDQTAAVAGTIPPVVEPPVVVPPVTDDARSATHKLETSKNESHLSVPALSTGTATAVCPTGSVATDGSVRLDAVDQGTGTFADAVVTASTATADGRGWTGTVKNTASGQVQGKVNVVCLETATTRVDGHTHDLVMSAPVTVDQSWTTSGTDEVVVPCATGTIAVAPSFTVTGGAAAVTGSVQVAAGWKFTVDVTDAADLSVGVSCLSTTTSQANGHTHALGVTQLSGTVDVGAGESLQAVLTCEVGGTGVVTSRTLGRGVVFRGIDPQSKSTLFGLFNPGTSDSSAAFGVLCVGIDTTGEASTAVVVPAPTDVLPPKPISTGPALVSVKVKKTARGAKIIVPVTAGSKVTIVAVSKVKGTKISKGTVLTSGKATGTKASLKLRGKTAKAVLSGKVKTVRITITTAGVTTSQVVRIIR